MLRTPALKETQLLR